MTLEASPPRPGGPAEAPAGSSARAPASSPAARTPPAGRQSPASSLRAVLAIASSLVSTQLVTALLGVVFWAAAARHYSAEAVGIASAATSAMAVLGVLGMLGLGTLMISELPQLRGHRQLRLLRAALTVSAVVSGVLGVAWGIVAGWTSEAMRPIGDNPVTVLIFAAGVAFTALTAVFDQAVLVRDRGGLQFLRNLVTAVTKVVCVLVLAAVGAQAGFSLYAAWVLGLALSLPICLIGVSPRSASSGRGVPAAHAPGGVREPADDRFWGFRKLREHTRSAAGHHLVNLALQAPTLLLPVLAAFTVSAAETAYFSSARLAATFIFMPPFALAIALFAGARGDIDRAAARMRVTLPLGIAISLALYGCSVVGAHPVLSLFGHEYAARALDPFLLMALAGIPLVVKDHYVALCRIQNHIQRAAVFVAVGTVAELGVAGVAGWRYGLNGLALGWSCVVMVEAIVVAPQVIGVAWRPAPGVGMLRSPLQPARAAGRALPSPSAPTDPPGPTGIPET